MYHLYLKINNDEFSKHLFLNRLVSKNQSLFTIYFLIDNLRLIKYQVDKI